MKKRILIGLILAAIIVVGGYLVQQSRVSLNLYTDRNVPASVTP